MATVNVEIADAVKAAMKRSGFTYRKLSDVTGIPLVTLNRRLNGHRSFQAEELVTIADALGICASEFLPARHRNAA